MMKEQAVLETINACGLVAIIRLQDLSSAIPISRALLTGGVVALELSLTNPAALEAIGSIKSALPEFTAGRAVIGAGTVTSSSDVPNAVNAGADFIISPHSNPELIKACVTLDVPVMPGALTPTEIMNACDWGAKVVKLFPASVFPPSYVRALRDPWPQLQLLPTGGINLENAAQYIQSGAFALGVGGSLVNEALAASKDWDTLTELAAAFIQAIQKARQGDAEI